MYNEMEYQEEYRMADLIRRQWLGIITAEEQAELEESLISKYKRSMPVFMQKSGTRPSCKREIYMWTDWM